MKEKEKELKEPLGAIEFGLKVKSKIVAVYSNGIEEPAQEVAKLYLKQVNLFKAQLAEKDRIIEKLGQSLQPYVKQWVSTKIDGYINDYKVEAERDILTAKGIENNRVRVELLNSLKKAINSTTTPKTEMVSREKVVEILENRDYYTENELMIYRFKRALAELDATGKDEI